MLIFHHRLSTQEFTLQDFICFWVYDSLSDLCQQTYIVAVQIAHVWSKLRKYSL